MFESHVTTQTLPAVESSLAANRKSCSILIHEKTGDHVYDHTKRGPLFRRAPRVKYRVS